MKVNDRVTVKTDGGPRRPGVVLAIEEYIFSFFKKGSQSPA